MIEKKYRLVNNQDGNNEIELKSNCSEDAYAEALGQLGWTMVCYSVKKDEGWYNNFYRCDCGNEWEDYHDHICNDKCGDCNAETTPYQSVDLNTDEMIDELSVKEDEKFEN